MGKMYFLCGISYHTVKKNANFVCLFWPLLNKKSTIPKTQNQLNLKKF